MSRFRNLATNVVVSVDDSKDERFRDGWVPADQEPAPAKPEGYAAMKIGALRAEIAKRNEGREEADLLPDGGKKADLIAALDADDKK